LFEVNLAQTVIKLIHQTWPCQ